MSWQSGEKVGTYQIERVLGTGGMATVYKAHHERLGRDVAIKVMHPAFVADEQFIARFEREARIVASLEHPNIVPVYDFAEYTGQPYLVMKYIQGQTLKQRYLKQGVPSLDEIVGILDAVANALNHAHQHGVLHRDVKPSNIIIDPDGTPYLTDFGLARILQTGETTMSAGMILGTPNYVSPEQASDDGQVEVTERSDVYSLGVVLFEMVVGRVPFESKTPYATIHKHIYEPSPLPSELNPEIPTQVEMVLLKALEKDPDDRYQTPTELAAAFKEAVEVSGLTELSSNRSSALLTRELPSINSVGAEPVVSKPKRETASDGGNLLLLLDDEGDWASLPRDEIAARRIKKRRDERIGFISHLLPYIGVNAAIIVGSLSDGNLDYASFITALAWGAGLAAHGINTWHQSTRQINKLYNSFYQHMTDNYGSTWRDTLSGYAIQKEWRQAKQIHQEWTGYFIHSAIFILINAMLWMIFIGNVLEDGSFGFPWPAIVMLSWGAGLIAHGAYVNRQKRPAHDDASIAAELAMMDGTGSSGTLPKRKNELEDHTPSGGVRLTGDGELTDSMVTEFENEQRRSRR